MSGRLPFLQIAGMVVARCIEVGRTLETLEIGEYKAICDQFDEDVYKAIDLEKCAFKRNSAGGPAPDCVKEEIKRIKLMLGDGE